MQSKIYFFYIFIRSNFYVVWSGRWRGERGANEWIVGDDRQSSIWMIWSFWMNWRGEEEKRVRNRSVRIVGRRQVLRMMDVVNGGLCEMRGEFEIFYNDALQRFG